MTVRPAAPVASPFRPLAPAAAPGTAAFAEGARAALAVAAERLPPTVSLATRGLEDASTRAAIDPAALGRLIVVLLTRAADALEGVGTILVTLEETLIDDAAALNLGIVPGPYARLGIGDTGDLALPDRALSEATAIVARHRGSLSLQARPGGRHLAIYLPIAAH